MIPTVQDAVAVELEDRIAELVAARRPILDEKHQ
jgi:hypothetical protein